MKEFTVKHSNMIKGIAIILMVFHHLFRIKQFSQGYTLSFWPFSIGRVAQITTFFKICVPLFTFVSGYGLLYFYKKLRNKKNFFKIRFFKLMPTFFIVSIISYIFFVIFNYENFIKTFFSGSLYSGIFHVIFDVLGIANFIHTPTICAEWWYISANLVFIFLVPILYKLAKKYGWFNVFVGIILIPRFLNIYNISTTTALPFVFSLLLGMYCRESGLIEKIVNYKIVKNNLLNKVIKCICYFILVLILYLYISHVSSTACYEINFGLLPFVVLLFCVEFIFPIKFLQNILIKLGEYSYIMYLTHTIILSLIKDFLYSMPHFIITGILLILISFIISFILKKVLEKINFYNFFDKYINKLKKN